MSEYPRSVEPGGAGTSPKGGAQHEKFGRSGMRSPRGSLGAIVLLLALPIAVLTQVVLGSGSGTIIHFVLAAGSALVSFSAFDFETPRWIAWIGGVSAGGLAAIFLAQGASLLLRNDSFTYFTNQVLGNWPERLLLSLVVLWLVALLLTASWGTTRMLGFVAMAMVVCVEVFGYVQLFFGTNTLSETPVLKLLYLPPFVWLLLESRKGRPKKVS